MPEDVHVKAAEIREATRIADTLELLNDLLRDTHTLGRLHLSACQYTSDCEEWVQYRAYVYREELAKRLKEAHQTPISKEDHLQDQLNQPDRPYAGKWVYLDDKNNILGSGDSALPGEELLQIGARTNHFVSKCTVLAPGVRVMRSTHP